MAIDDFDSDEGIGDRRFVKSSSSNNRSLTNPKSSILKNSSSSYSNSKKVFHFIFISWVIKNINLIPKNNN
jgi:hypothetical protein